MKCLPTFTTTNQHCIGILARAIEQEKEIRFIQIARGNVKSSLVAGDIFYAEKIPENL